jgi:hypothetical protein
MLCRIFISPRPRFRIKSGTVFAELLAGLAVRSTARLQVVVVALHLLQAPVGILQQLGNRKGRRPLIILQLPARQRPPVFSSYAIGAPGHHTWVPYFRTEFELGGGERVVAWDLNIDEEATAGIRLVLPPGGEHTCIMPDLLQQGWASAEALQRALRPCWSMRAHKEGCEPSGSPVCGVIWTWAEEKPR